MKLNVKALRDGLELCKLSVPTKPTLKIIANVLLENGKLTATNLEHSVQVDVANPFALALQGENEGGDLAKVGEFEGDSPVSTAILLPFQRVMELLTRVPGTEMLTLEQKGKSVSLSWTGGRASFATEGEPREYPPVPLPQSHLTTTVDGDALIAAMAEIAVYAATEGSRPVLNTVALFLQNPVTVVAADGFRLAYKTVPISIEREGIETALVPLESVYVLEYLHKKAPRTPPREGTFAEILSAKRQLAITMDTALLQIKTGKLTFTTQLVQGSFPNYKGLIPAEDKFTASVTLMAPDLEHAVRTVRGPAKDTSGIVRLNWMAEYMTVSAGGDEASTEVNIAIANATPGRVGLNVAYLLPYLNGKDSMMTMKLSGEKFTGPVCFIYGTAPAIMIMPMQVQWADELQEEATEVSLAATGGVGEEAEAKSETETEPEIVAESEPAPPAPKMRQPRKKRTPAKT